MEFIPGRKVSPQEATAVRPSRELYAEAVTLSVLQFSKKLSSPVLLSQERKRENEQKRIAIRSIDKYLVRGNSKIIFLKTEHSKMVNSVTFFEAPVFNSVLKVSTKFLFCNI